MKAKLVKIFKLFLMMFLALGVLSLAGCSSKLNKSTGGRGDDVTDDTGTDASGISDSGTYPGESDDGNYLISTKEVADYKNVNSIAELGENEVTDCINFATSNSDCDYDDTDLGYAAENNTMNVLLVADGPTELQVRVLYTEGNDYFVIYIDEDNDTPFNCKSFAVSYKSQYVPTAKFARHILQEK